MQIQIEHPTEDDITALHAILKETYWSPGIPREVVEKACAHSLCAIARDDAGALIGFARLVTDRAVFAWLCDVVVVPTHQGRGIGRALVSVFRNHPELQHLRRWMLGTRDAHGVYADLGFTPIGDASRLMEILGPAPYGKPTQ